MDSSQTEARDEFAPDPDTPPNNAVADNVTSGFASTSSLSKVKRLPLRSLALLIILVGTMVILITLYSFNTGLRLAERYTPLIDATMEVKLSATTAHLWFEEMVSNDRAENFNSVRRHLQEADWYAEAMLKGGTNEEGTFIPLDDPVLRGKIEHTRELLVELNRLMELRWRAHLSTGGGTAHDPAFDHIFADLVVETDQVETSLQSLNRLAIQTFRIIQFCLGALTLIATLIIVSVLMRFAHEQNRNLETLHREVEQRVEAEETLRRQATTDTLTKLFNRRHITDLMNQELKRAGRRDTPFCLIMFDLDHFKSINDNFGHDTGDRVLQTVAETIRERLRELDAFARWGGEEFLILVRETKLDGAMALAETCRARLALTDIETVGRVTASFGVAQYMEGETLRELVHRADQALYAAKNAGRNRVMGAKAKAS
ncbi:MAG: GGDEF domain-containing protein [Rhodospirillales bacterium]|nr:GGDEF domain-containing protein [Rhodospirillales bacterium]